MDYMNYISIQPDFKKESFNPDARNMIAKTPIKGYKTVLSALSLGGMILLPVKKPVRLSRSQMAAENRRRKLIAAAKEGDEEAIESLTIDDIDTYTDLLWNSLNEANKVSLFVRFIDLKTGEAEDRIVHKYQKTEG